MPWLMNELPYSILPLLLNRHETRSESMRATVREIKEVKEMKKGKINPGRKMRVLP